MHRKSGSRISESNAAEEMWINPDSNLRGPDGNRAWQSTGNIAPASGAKFLELADIALGIKKPAHRARRKNFRPSGEV